MTFSWLHLLRCWSLLKTRGDSIVERDAALVRATQVTKELKVVTDEKDQALEEVRKKDEEIALLQSASRLIPKHDDIVTESNVATIIRVSEGIKGKYGQRAIILHMSDGTERANNWEGGYSARLELAERLRRSEKKVKTDVWNKPGTNHKWWNWFKNIYVVE